MVKSRTIPGSCDVQDLNHKRRRIVQNVSIFYRKLLFDYNDERNNSWAGKQSYKG